MGHARAPLRKHLAERPQSPLAVFGSAEGKLGDRQAGIELAQGRYLSFKRAQDLVAYLKLPGAKAKVTTK
jgi:hypothetical protein